MAEFVDNAVKDIDSRLRELKEEVDRLQAARAALVGSTPRRRGRPRGSTSNGRRTARRPGRPRGRRGSTRANQALELVRSRPGITIPEIAEAMKIEPNYLYRVMPRLVSEGQVKRDGHGWQPDGTS